MIRKLITFKCPLCNEVVDIEEDDLIYQRVKDTKCPKDGEEMKKVGEILLGGLISEN